ncbi:MAG: NAD(P)-dependent alcohol dehydrogenase [Bacteroidota bacterium]
MKARKMKAAVYNKYGPPEVVHIQEVQMPIPKDKEVLIKIHATAVSSGDVRLRKADPFLVRLFFGLFKPRVQVLGVDFAGVVEAVGKNVTQYALGDEVFGSAFENGFGSHAEYICMPENGMLAHKPKNVSFTESAAIFFGGHSSLDFLRRGNLKKGDKVLIYGASGALGTYAVQLAHYYGAEVHGVCSGKNAELVKSLGADKVIDYTKEDFTALGEKYDIIFDTIGKSPFTKSVNTLQKKGKYLRAVNMKLKSILLSLFTSLMTSKKVIAGVAAERREDLLFLKKLIEEQKIKPIIDRTYHLTQIAEAHGYVEKGHKVGNVVITV